MVSVFVGTYGFACGRDLYRLIKFWQDSLLHFAFSQTRWRIWFTLRNLGQIGLLLCQSSMHAPSCVTWTVPEALGNMESCQAGNKHGVAREMKSPAKHYYQSCYHSGFFSMEVTYKLDFNLRQNGKKSMSLFFCTSLGTKVNWFHIVGLNNNLTSLIQQEWSATVMLLFPRTQSLLYWPDTACHSKVLWLNNIKTESHSFRNKLSIIQIIKKNWSISSALSVLKFNL